MSAIRRNSSRSETRKKRSTPYARGLFGTFARFFGFSDPSPVEDSIESDGDASVVQSPKSPYASSNHAPFTPNRSGNVFSQALRDDSSLPVPNSEEVASYFSHRMGANVTANEVESMVTNLQTTPERERFRFTFTTPGRESPPSFSSPSVNTSALPSTTPSRKLSKNPNGVYRWEGAGSAKAARQRNRFGSPAFGASPTKPGSAVAEAAKPNQDNKRRKVAEAVSTAAQSTNPTSSVPFPHSSPTTRTNGITRRTSPLPPSRLRTPAKPTAPVNPSPLRQAWSDVSSTSSHEDNKLSPPLKQTMTANFVAELIKETAPPKKPDLSNPYQTASPVGKVGPPRRANKRPRAAGRPVPPTKEQKAEEEKKKAEEQRKKEEETKLKALSAQAIIEATVPKGSKRSRPPANLEKQSSGNVERSTSPPPRGSAHTEKVSYVVEEIDDEDLKRTVKKSKPTVEGYGLPSSLAKPLQSDVTIEEIDEVEMQSADKGKAKEPVSEPSKSAVLAGSTSRPTPFTGFTSIPREPSKLRFSFQAEPSPSSTASAPVSPQVSVSLPIPLTTSGPASTPISAADSKSAPPSIQNVSSGFNFTFKPSSTLSAEESNAKATEQAAVRAPDVVGVEARVRGMDAKSLPTFVLVSTGSSSSSQSTERHVSAQERAKAVPVSSLPAFDLSSTKPFSVGFGSSNSKPLSTPNTFSLPNNTSSPAFNPFSGSMPSSISTTNIFGTKPLAVPTPPIPAIVKPFDFAGAGMTQPTGTTGTWNCGLCGLSNPQTATKCTICDAIKPDSNSQPPAASLPSTPTPLVQAFNWGAAGLKAPTVSISTWNCSRCGLSSPTTTDKCTICDEPRAPAGSSSSTSSVSTPPKPLTSSFNVFAAPSAKPADTPPVKPFNFAAAGLKPPTFEKGTWVCSLCRLSNPETASTCTTCENPK